MYNQTRMFLVYNSLENELVLTRKILYAPLRTPTITPITSEILMYLNGTNELINFFFLWYHYQNDIIDLNE